MNLTPQQLALLDQLDDIVLPEPVGWWPLASTWWIMLGLIGVVIIGFIWSYFEQKKRNAYRLEALNRLNEIEQTPSSLENKTLNQKIIEINSLLKQVALTAYGRTQVAPLTDQAWLNFLKDKATYIAQPDNLITHLTLSYQPPAETEEQHNHNQTLLIQWQTYARKWIKGHHQ